MYIIKCYSDIQNVTETWRYDVIHKINLSMATRDSRVIFIIHYNIFLTDSRVINSMNWIIVMTKVQNVALDCLGIFVDRLAIGTIWDIILVLIYRICSLILLYRKVHLLALFAFCFNSSLVCDICLVQSHFNISYTK